MEKNRVVVTGLGVLCALGNDVPSFWQALKEGKSGVDILRTFDASKFDSYIAGEVKGFDPNLYGMSSKDIRRMDKFVQYAIAAATEAIRSSGLNLEKEDRTRM